MNPKRRNNYKKTMLITEVTRNFTQITTAAMMNITKIVIGTLKKMNIIIMLLIIIIKTIALVILLNIINLLNFLIVLNLMMLIRAKNILHFIMMKIVETKKPG